METQQPAEPRSRRRFSTRGFTSLLLTLSLLVMGFSGVMLYLTPRGRVAHWTDWSLLGLGKEQWGALHMNASLLFLLAAVLHLVINWSTLLRYLKKKTVAGVHMKRELALASVIALAAVAGTLYGIPPFSSVVALNDDIKDYWEERSAPAPMPHAEELTLEEFAARINLPVKELTKTLHQEGFDAADVQLTVMETGRQKGVAASEVFAAVRKHHPPVGAMTGGNPGWQQGRGPGPGQGHEPGMGRGMGVGQGMGMGRGMGMGMGRGRGMGRGQSQGPGSESGEACANE